MNLKIEKIEKYNIIIGFLLCILLLPGMVRADNDTVTINVGVATSAMIEVTPYIATFTSVIPGSEPDIPASLRFTITNVGSTNFTNMYVSVDVPTDSQEANNPLGTGVPANYYAGGFVVLMNDTMLTVSDQWKFVGRQEWNLTDKPSDYTVGDDVVAWGYFGNTSRQYFWDLKSNDTDGTCNQTGTQIRIKNWAVNGSAAAYNLETPSGDRTVHDMDTKVGENWGIFNAQANGPLANYCIAARTDCKRIFIYQWRQGDTLFDQCTDYWYIYNDATNKFKPNDQFYFNMTVWVPKGIPAGSTSSSILTVAAI